MKGIVLAGGTGSRLYPLTKVTNKHLLPVGDKPMIFHPIHKLLEAGITDILIVTGVEHMGDVVSLLGSGKEFDCEFTYRVQDESGGIAEALGLAKHFVNGDKMVVILGDNIFEDSIKGYVDNYEGQQEGARLILKKVDDPERFGVATLQDGKIQDIVEKPKDPKSDLAVTGVYMYDAQVFDFIDQLSPSQRGELEITDVNNFYIQEGHVEYDMFKGWWTDAGTFSSLQRANRLARKVFCI
ncbi:MAG: NTP transferase domain-containing protein [Candidatus Margulisbacteria bacterium]|nr:NTP transferase domain-containing protein [Candidatus Margulisiibacteriota bacterium]